MIFHKALYEVNILLTPQRFVVSHNYIVERNLQPYEYPIFVKLYMKSKTFITRNLLQSYI